MRNGRTSTGTKLPLRAWRASRRAGPHGRFRGLACTSSWRSSRISGFSRHPLRLRSRSPRSTHGSNRLASCCSPNPIRTGVSCEACLPVAGSSVRGCMTPEWLRCAFSTAYNNFGAQIGISAAFQSSRSLILWSAAKMQERKPEFASHASDLQPLAASGVSVSRVQCCIPILRIARRSSERLPCAPEFYAQPS